MCPSAWTPSRGVGRQIAPASLKARSPRPIRLAPMSATEATSAASRLCSACGLCCNGVMFHTVKLQPADSAKELAALGLKLKHKKSGSYIQQPFPQYQYAECAIYTVRPQRCRLFECRQLKRVAAGEITEAMALEKVTDV